MQELLQNIEQKIVLNQEDIALLEKIFVPQEVFQNTQLLAANKVEKYLYFLAKGIVKGYHYRDGKLIVEHLIEEGNFFSSFQSFMQETPSLNAFETVTKCKMYKITKTEFDTWKNTTNKWNEFIQEVINEHLNCKMERVREFQTLSAKERYLNFIENHPKMVLSVKIDTLASFLGIEPQSLSRIRKQIII